MKNIEGQSTSSEETPEYFSAKGALSLKNENIICDNIYWFFCKNDFLLAPNDSSNTLDLTFLSLIYYP
jgi:hypothetical protein